MRRGRLSERELEPAHPVQVDGEEQQRVVGVELPGEPFGEVQRAEVVRPRRRPIAQTEVRVAEPLECGRQVGQRRRCALPRREPLRQRERSQISLAGGRELAGVELDIAELAEGDGEGPPRIGIGASSIRSLRSSNRVKCTRACSNSPRLRSNSPTRENTPDLYSSAFRLSSWVATESTSRTARS